MFKMMNFMRKNKQKNNVGSINSKMDARKNYFKTMMNYGLGENLIKGKDQSFLKLYNYY